MNALSDRPPDEGEQTTGMGCPDCPGALAVSAVDRHLHFRCRIGHAYSLTELVLAKEKTIEDLLWAPVTALTELATLLRELDAGGYGAEVLRFRRERADRALHQVEMLRKVIEDNEPTVLDTGPRERSNS